MKKILLIIGLAAMFTANVNSQTLVTTMSGTGDTLTGTHTEYVSYAPTKFYNQVSFQSVITKVAGTITTTAIGAHSLLQHSNDNSTWKDVNTDTLTWANQTTNTKIWVVAYNSSYYYRIKNVGKGTDTVIVKGYMLTQDPFELHRVYNFAQSNGSTTDTITNSATGYVSIALNYSYTRLSIQAVVTEISGTTGGTVTLQGSNDGLNFVTVSSSYADATTFAPADQAAAQSKIFVITGSPYKYYKLNYTGTGTMSAKLKGYLVPSK